MIIGVGCDIAEHDITEALNWQSDSNILKRVFSQAELTLYENQKNKEFLVGRFAAKEAVLKCLGTGMQDGISLTDVQILQRESGKPIIEVQGEVKKISNHLGIESWHISISHCSDYSFAFVVAEGSKTN